MESSRNNCRSPSSRKWCNLPCDILILISQKLDENHDHQLRAVCTSWNSSLPKSPSTFPLQIPCPIVIPSPEGDDKEKVISLSNRFRFYAVERSVILVSPLNKEAAQSPSPWIANVEEITGLNKRAVFCPLSGMRISPCCCCNGNNYVCTDSIDMLDFCVTEITKAYSILWVDTYTEGEGCYHTHSCSLPELYMYLRIKKLIAYHAPGEEGVIVLLALRADDGKLAYWKSGCEEWKIIDSLQPNHSRFVDIICFDAKFCAVDFHRNLIMIDPLTLQPVKSVPEPYSINEYSAISAYLVHCEKHLYLVKIVACIGESDDQWDEGVFCPEIEKHMHCFVLTEKGWVSNGGGFGPNKNAVFVLGEDVTYSLSPKLLGSSSGNFAFYGATFNLGDKFEFDLFMNDMYSKKDIFEYDPAYAHDTGAYDYFTRSFQTFEKHPYDCYDETNFFWPPPERKSNSHRFWQSFLH